MVSVAIGSHGADIAHGYAAMSGEYGFRQAGQKATTVPHEHRAIVTAHLPMDWVHKNVDRNFGGNPTDVKHRLADPGLHFQHVVKTGSDFSPTETPELRFKEAIPAKYIKGYTQKGKKMKTFKEFTEGVRNFPIEDGGPFHIYRMGGQHQYRWKKHTDIGYSSERSAMRAARKEFGPNHNPGFKRDDGRLAKTPWKVIQHDPDDQHEEVATNAMSAQSPSAIANPQNRMLFKSVGKRKRVNDTNQGIERDPGQSEPERRSEFFRTHRRKQMRLGVGE